MVHTAALTVRVDVLGEGTTFAGTGVAPPNRTYRHDTTDDLGSTYIEVWHKEALC